MSAGRENKTERFNMFFSPSELKSIEEWAWKHRIRSKSEAVRRLVQIALSNDGIARKSLEELAASVSGEGIAVSVCRPPTDADLSGLKALFDAVPPVGDIDEVGPAS